MKKRSSLKADDAVQALYALMKGAESEPARIQAAKILLQRLEVEAPHGKRLPKEDERKRAVAEAMELLEEFASLRTENLLLKAKLAEAGAAGTDNA